MSRLLRFLKRVLNWRELWRSGASMARWARFAGAPGIFRHPETMALAPTGFDTLCARAGAQPVTSAEALLADRAKAPRCWTIEARAPAAQQQTHLLALDGCHPPTFENAPSTPLSKQAYLRLQRGIVFPRTGLVMREPGVVHRINLPTWTADHRLMPGFLNFADDALVARTSALHPRRRIRRLVLVLCHAFHRNYGHWLFDFLPSLRPWIGPLRQRRLAALLPPLQGEWQKRMLDLVGVPASAVIEAPEPSILCDDMIVPGLTLRDGQEPARLPSWIRQPAPTVRETIDALRRAMPPTTEIESSDRIYVSRRRLVSFREMRNEEEVEAALARLGFAVVHPQDLTFDQQLAMFVRARVIVGPHGAGLTNAAFAPPGCLVIDIFPGRWNTMWVLHLTQLFGHHYLPVAYANDPALSQPILLGDAVIRHSEVYNVPADEFAGLVLRAMRRLGIEPHRNGAA